MFNFSGPTPMRVHFAEIQDGDFYSWHEDFDNLRSAVDTIAQYEQLDYRTSRKRNCPITLISFMERINHEQL